MKLLSDLLSLIVALALLFALAFVVYSGFHFVLDILDKQMKAILIFSSLVLLLGTLIVAGGIREAKKLEIKQRLASKKALVYGRFIETWAEAYQKQETRNFEEDMKKTKKSSTFDKDMLLWASSTVVQHYNALQKLENQGVRKRCKFRSLRGRYCWRCAKILETRIGTLRKEI